MYMKKLIFLLLLIPALSNGQMLGGRLASSSILRNKPVVAVESDNPAILHDRLDKFVNSYQQKTTIIYTIVAEDSIAQLATEKFFIGKIPVVQYKPSDFDPAKKYPVVLFLHGKGEIGNGTDAELTSKIINSTNQAGLLAAADKYKWIVVAPQLVLANNSWIPGWTNTYLQPVYDYIIKNNFTDLSQIYVTGLSLGGGGTWIACTGPFAPYIAAAVVICGTPQYEQDFSLIAKNKIPVWAFHAKNDNTVGYAATVNTVNAINKYSPDPAPIMTLFESGDHYIWGKVYGDDNVYQWMLANKKQVSGTTPAPPAKKMLSICYFSDGSYVVIYDDKSIEFKK